MVASCLGKALVLPVHHLASLLQVYNFRNYPILNPLSAQTAKTNDNRLRAKQHSIKLTLSHNVLDARENVPCFSSGTRV
jgi:hypothetical protein